MEEKKLKLKRIIEISLFVLTAIFAFLALVFNVYDVEATFEEETIREAANGFKLLEGYPEVLQEIGGWMVGYSYIILTIIVIEIILYVILSIKKASETVVIERIFVLLNVVLTLIYMINGFSAKSTIESQDLELILSALETETVAFVPFIVVVLFTVLYFIVPFFVKNDIVFGIKPKKPNAVAAVDELAIYMQLLNDGLITQEDYDAKKKELLGL